MFRQFVIRMLAMMVIAGTATSAYADSCYDVIISVDRTKANGNEWDAAAGNYAPDIVTVISGKSYPKCQDSYECVLYDVRVSQRVVSVDVIDKDAFADDPIGSGQCALGHGGCIVGRARLTTMPCQ